MSQFFLCIIWHCHSNLILTCRQVKFGLLYRICLFFSTSLECKNLYCLLSSVLISIIKINSGQHLARKYMLGYLSADINCSEKQTAFLELRSGETVHFSKQMSADKYPRIFSGQMEAILFIILQIFLAYTVVKTGEYINNSHHLALKYARIFVRGHYLFREVNSFPRAKLEENCELRGTDNVQGQISEHIFALNKGCCLYYLSNISSPVLAGEYSVT